MNIPNDTGHPYRLNKFVEYQHEVPSIHYRTLVRYSQDCCNSCSDTVMLAWLVSCTYSEITAAVLFDDLFRHILDEWPRDSDVEAYWARYKDSLIFGNGRHYVKNMDQFPDLIRYFGRLTRNGPLTWLINLCDGTPEENYKRIAKQIGQIKHVGRFATDLFMEAIVHACNQDLLPEYVQIREPSDAIDWKRGGNLTSGVFNIFYQDRDADIFDKEKTLSDIDIPWLNNKLDVIAHKIHKTYPDQDYNIQSFVGKICSFRNLFKGRRYAGYHHDRQLEHLKKYACYRPDHRKLWDYFYFIRQDMFDPKWLGEIGGWAGIRKERTKLWLKEGKTGAES